MGDRPFSSDKLNDVPRYVYKGSFMTKCDDKSGYDHVSLSLSSQTYVGFEWKGYWFVCTTLTVRMEGGISLYLSHNWFCSHKFLPFHWNTMFFVLDDRLNGECVTSSGPWSVLPESRQERHRLNAATAALWCVW